MPAPTSECLACADAVLSEAADALLQAKVRIWVSGEIALEALEDPRQGQQFANWAKSRLRYDVGVGDEPPAEYTGITYRTLKPRVEAE